ncbi:TPA: hypothetical protein ACG1X2_004828, partial [Escherichia coli]
IFALTFQNHTNCPLTDFGGKRVFLVILFTSFSGSLVSRISGAVHALKKRDIYVNPSWRYADPRAGLIEGKE